MSADAIRDRFRRLGEMAAAAGPDDVPTDGAGDGPPALRLAVTADGLHHLLVPARAPVAPDRRSAAVRIGERSLIHPTTGESLCFADLYCIDPMMNGVFDTLVADVIGACSDASDRDLESVMRETLSAWRHLLAAAAGGISKDAALGLFAELSVLAQLAEAKPHTALDAWTGPLAEPHDFRHQGRAIEVKATGGDNTGRIKISSLRQLDSAGLAHLSLVVLSLSDSPDGMTLDEKVEEVMEEGVPEQQFVEMLSRVGFVRGMEVGTQRRLSVRAARAWTVDDTFPRLTPSDIEPAPAAAISAVSYSVNLDLCPQPAIPGWTAAQLLFDGA